MPVKNAALKLIKQFRLSFFQGYNPSTIAAVPVVLRQELKHPRIPTMFDINKVAIEPANVGNVREIEQYLHENYFRNDPIIKKLGIRRDGQYLTSLAKKYAITGDRLLAFEMEPKLRKRKLIGALAAYKKFPWEAARLKNVADWSPRPESYHLYFCSYCIRSADVFNKYMIPYLYDIEMLSVAKMGLGVEKQLLQTVMMNAVESELYPLIQVFSTNKFLDAACEEAGMTLEWSRKLSDLSDENNNSLFYRNSEDDGSTINLYVRLFSPNMDNGVYHPDGQVRQTLAKIHKKNLHTLENSFLEKYCIGNSSCETLR